MRRENIGGIMKEFKIKSKHIEYPEILKHELDTITRHGYEVVGVEDGKLLLEESAKTYNFLIDENTTALREHYIKSGCGYVELNVQKIPIRVLGYSITKVKPATRENANYLLVKSTSREPVLNYKENLEEYHKKASQNNLVLTIIYTLFFLSVLIFQNRVVNNLTIYGYYILSLTIIGFLVNSFYKFLRHKEIK